VRFSRRPELPQKTEIVDDPGVACHQRPKVCLRLETRAFSVPASEKLTQTAARFSNGHQVG